MKKKFQNIYKCLIYFIFKAFHGKIKGIIKLDNKNDIKEVFFGDKHKYSIYFCQNSRLYTDTIHDTAIIRNNFLIDGPSFQFRDNKMAEAKYNSIFHKGTPRIKKKLRGKVFSLLTGGGGNNNYYHWLFDVLPRLVILREKIKLTDIDYFLFPRIDLPFQKQSLDLLNIPITKRLSSQTFRHVYADEIIAVDHPCVILNDPLKDNENIPDWIINFYKDELKIKVNFEKKYDQIFIDRDDSTSNIKHLRKIINNKEVKEFLVKKGFKIIKLSTHSFVEQINIFHHANKIVGLHGAGFSNLLFCRPNTKIVEIKPSHVGDQLKNLGQKLNLDYINLLSETQSLKYNFPNQLGDIFVDLKELEKSIN